MSLTTILLIGAGIILLLWLMIRFKLYKVFAEIIDGLCDVFD
jgi:H+/gluconate symporter-like permease